MFRPYEIQLDGSGYLRVAKMFNPEPIPEQVHAVAGMGIYLISRDPNLADIEVDSQKRIYSPKLKGTPGRYLVIPHTINPVLARVLQPMPDHLKVVSLSSVVQSKALREKYLSQYSAVLLDSRKNDMIFLHKNTYSQEFDEKYIGRN